MNIVDVLQSGFGSGLARLARASLLLDVRDVETNEAVRFTLEQLFKRDTPVRQQSLARGAAALRSLPERKRPVGESMLIDLLCAACFARTDRRDEAIALVEGWRQLLAPIIAHHQEAGRVLECSAVLEDRARAALLREEAFELEMSFDVYATDVLDDGEGTAVMRKDALPKPVRPMEEQAREQERKLVVTGVPPVCLSA